MKNAMRVQIKQPRTYLAEHHPNKGFLEGLVVFIDDRV